MGRSATSVKQATKRRRLRKKIKFQEKNNSRTKESASNELCGYHLDKETITPSENIDTSDSQPECSERGESSSFTEITTSNVSKANKYNKVCNSVKRLEKLFEPSYNPYYSSDPLARAFCEWTVLKREKKYLEEFCLLSN